MYQDLTEERGFFFKAFIQFGSGKDNLNVNLSPNHKFELTGFTTLKTLHLLT